MTRAATKQVLSLHITNSTKVKRLVSLINGLPIVQPLPAAMNHNFATRRCWADDEQPGLSGDAGDSWV